MTAEARSAQAIATMSGAGRARGVCTTYHDAWSLDGMEMGGADATSEEEMAEETRVRCAV